VEDTAWEQTRRRAGWCSHAKVAAALTDGRRVRAWPVYMCACPRRAKLKREVGLGQQCRRLAVAVGVGEGAGADPAAQRAAAERLRQLAYGERGRLAHVLKLVRSLLTTPSPLHAPAP
jgi:hypothetical protein